MAAGGRKERQAAGAATTKLRVALGRLQKAHLDITDRMKHLINWRSDMAVYLQLRVAGAGSVLADVLQENGGGGGDARRQRQGGRVEPAREEGKNIFDGTL